MKPWADAPRSRCCDFPVTPALALDAERFPRDRSGDVRELVCMECGKVETCKDRRRVAQAWWSAGAWAGHQATADERRRG